MKLSYSDIIDSRKGEAAVVVGAGPSLNNNKKQIIDAQKDGLIKICVNEWFRLFENNSKPDYLVLASGHHTDSITAHGPIANELKFPIFYANSTDATPQSWVEENMKADWFGFDQRHWQGKNCRHLIGEIAHWIAEEYHRLTGEYPLPNSIKEGSTDGYPLFPIDMHSLNAVTGGSSSFFRGATSPKAEELKEMIQRAPEGFSLQNLKMYGNNGIMWDGRWPYGGLCEAVRWEFDATAGWRAVPRFPCTKVGDASTLTVQETLQNTSGFDCHYSTGDTVIVHALAFAILMGCNPIYVTGMDLDYRVGYASSQAAPLNNDWQRFARNLINDLKILNESAIMRGIEIINLQKDAWYGQIKHGELK
tara:strand:- start:3207 stop:4295 length:1089 start_codon:yes stop_codon:yes gene_type:complete